VRRGDNQDGGQVLGGVVSAVGIEVIDTCRVEQTAPVNDLGFELAEHVLQSGHRGEAGDSACIPAVTG
jgi:hypothetical protein